ncbi:MAG: mechanosensitive ion channel [Anaerolineales bacterium]|nr:mechanosensitive ion channel [Anaerolineales bacterium]
MNLSDLSLDKISTGLLNFLPRLAMAFVVLLLARWISSFAKRLVRRSLEARESDPELIVLFEMLTNWGILAFGIVIAVEQLAPGQFSSLIAGLGIAGITIGFALQDVAKNFVAGLLLLLQQPFEIGDAIEVVGYAGTVHEISLRSTDIITWDGRHAIIPNADVFINPIVNFSRAVRRRGEVTLGVSYESDLDHVTKVTLEAVEKVPGVLKDPAPSVLFRKFGDSAIELTTFFWADIGEVGLGDAQNECIRNIKQAYHREGIEMPFPTYITIQGSP